MIEQSRGNAKRPMVSLLTTGLIEKIVEEAKDALEQTGVLMRDDEGLELLGNGGARIDKVRRMAFIPRRLVEASLKTVPASVKFYDRNGKLHATLEGTNSYYNPGTSAKKVWDSDIGQMRDPVTKDQIELVKVTDALDNIKIQSANYYPVDVPVEIAGHFRHFLCMRYGTKPFWGSMTTKGGVQVTKDMQVAIRGSEQALREKPLHVFPICPVSPLTWGTESYYFLTRLAKIGIPVLVTPVTAMGATAPITIVGDVIQHTAENLSGVVMAQLVNPGAPVIFGGAPTAFDMRYGTTPLGAVETMMLNIGLDQVGKYLKMPTEGYIGASDAKRPDSQSGLEAGIGLVLGALAGANLITGVGMLDLETTTSLEKLVIDNEICGMAYRLVRGVTPRGKRLAEDLFTEGVFEGKHFLTSPTTLKWFKEEISYPGPVISREDDQVWMKKGATTAEQRAKEVVKKILATHEPEPLDKDIDRELVHIMTKEAEKYGMSKLPLP